MSLAHLFDTQVAIWRAQLAPGALREEVRTWVRVVAPPGRPNAVVNRPNAPTGEVGPGLEPIGTRRLYMAASTDVQPRDVVEFVTGPDAGFLGEVDEPPTRPRGHHVQLDLRLWNGRLPGHS